MEMRWWHQCTAVHLAPRASPPCNSLPFMPFDDMALLLRKRHYAQSTVCPGCLKDYHTTFRVTQHLRYRRNGCWDRIFGARAPDTPVTIELPTHLSKVKRLPAVRRHYGPIRPTSVQRSRIALRQAIVALRAEGKLECAWWFPSDDEPLVRQANDLLRAALHEWIAMQHPTEIDFQNVMFGALFSLEAEDPQRCRLFIHWIEKHMYDDCPADMGSGCGDPFGACLSGDAGRPAYMANPCSHEDSHGPLDEPSTWSFLILMCLLLLNFIVLMIVHTSYRRSIEAWLISKPSIEAGISCRARSRDQLRPTGLIMLCTSTLGAGEKEIFNTGWSTTSTSTTLVSEDASTSFPSTQRSTTVWTSTAQRCGNHLLDYARAGRLLAFASRATMRDMVSGAMPSSTWWRSTRPSPIAYSCWIVGIAPAFDGWIAAAQCGQLLAAQGHLVIGRSDLSLGINCLGASCHALRRGLCIGVAERNTLSSTSRRSSFPPHNDTAMAVWCRGRQAHHALVQQWIASESFGGMWVGWRH